MNGFARCAFSAALMLTSIAAQSDEPRWSPPDGPRVVLVQSGAGRGSEMPSFALYGDRTVVFRAPAELPAPSGYVSTRLGEPEYLALMSSVAPESLQKLRDSYVAMTSADPPSQVLHVWVDGRRKTISVFGDLADPRARARIPPEFLRAFDAVKAFAMPASPWLPEMGTSMYLFPRKHSRGEPLPWPSDLMPSGNPGIKMTDGPNGFVIHSKNFASLQRLIGRLKPGQAVRFDGRNWAVSYRPLFPYEEAWRERDSDHELVAMPLRATAPVGGHATKTLAEPSVVFEMLGGRGGAGGTNSPEFALYTDRRVIFRAPDNASSPSGYLSTRISQAEYQALMASVAPQTLFKLGDSYNAVTGTDPVANIIHMWIDGRRKTVSVVGHLWECGVTGSRDKTPPEFLRAYDTITGFAAPARPWLPPSIEVLLWPRERFEEEILSWPRGWPSLEGARIHEDGLHLISLPAGQFGRLKKLLSDDDQHHTVKIENRLWTIDYHLPFPHEKTWAH